MLGKAHCVVKWDVLSCVSDKRAEYECVSVVRGRSCGRGRNKSHRWLVNVMVGYV